MKKYLRALPATIANARSFRKNPTIAEQRLWDALRNRELGGCKFRRQHPIGSLVLDFFCREKALAIVVDGEIHSQLGVAEHDFEREKYLRLLGVKILRFTNRQVLDELLDELHEVLGQILKALEN
jgi:very-short-patch-repair endonuclease